MAKSGVDDFDEGQMFTAPPLVPEAPSGNPLLKYYRMPGLNVALPTGGVFMPPGSIVLSQAGDVPVLPMRSQDELLLKNPDALMSGYAIEKLIESCVPAIRSARLISTPDLDVLLLAIRAATYGDTMTMTAPCPACKEENEYTANLPDMLSTMQQIAPENPVRLSDEVVAYVRPYNLHNATALALASFEEARKHQALEASDTGQHERTRAMNESMERLTRVHMHILADCLVKVVVPGVEVEDRRAIYEFLTNVSKPWVNRIEEALSAINALGVDKTVHASCAKCAHKWTTEVEFNPSTFFAEGSSR